MDTTVSSNLAAVLARIRNAEKRFGRRPGSVHLLAVSKGVTLNAIMDAMSTGQFRFGENYVQDALPKISAGLLAGTGAEWHFIGGIQANKTRWIAEHFSWVHAVDRIAIAERLNAQRPNNLPPLNVCVQVKIDAEPAKAGVAVTQLADLAAAIIQFPRLCLRGLMTLPQPQTDFALQRVPYRTLRAVMIELIERGFALDTLSMGMSSDMDAAIAEGATLVRIGTAIFGARGIGT